MRPRDLAAIALALALTPAPASPQLVVLLPDGSELEAVSVDVYPDAQTVVVNELPLFADGFEGAP